MYDMSKFSIHYTSMQLHTERISVIKCSSFKVNETLGFLQLLLALCACKAVIALRTKMECVNFHTYTLLKATVCVHNSLHFVQSGIS